MDLLSIDDIVLVEVFEGKEDVRGVKGRILEFETLAVADVEVEFAPVAIV